MMLYQFIPLEFAMMGTLIQLSATNNDGEVTINNISLELGAASSAD